jgi:hypothetical protein
MPWEVYWIIEAKTKDSEPRKREEANAKAYDMLKAARGDTDTGPMTLDDLKKMQAQKAANTEGTEA